MSIFKAIVVSKDENFKMSTEKFSQCGIDICQVSNNIQPLTKVYNTYISKIKLEQDKPDFIMFMHADVSVDIKHLTQHIDECKDKYDVMGLCGCSKISVSQSPLNWFCGSRPYQQYRWGCVTHGELGNQTSFFSQHSPEITDHEVACIDGLCIVFGKNALQSDLMFDERFKFDQYDTDISFQCVLEKHLRLGVIVEKSLQHYSIGKSILSQDFLIHEIDFRNKWHLDISDELKQKTSLKTAN